MENFENIKFDNDLRKNKVCKITYSGFLFQNGSSSVTIVYGFNSNWENTDAKEMKKTDNGFCIEIDMLDFDSFNFCFRNSNYEWDNNYNNNYTAKILPNDESTSTSNPSNDEINIETNTKEPEINSIQITPEESIQSFEVDVLNNQAMNIEESLVDSTEEVNLNSDIENLFENIYNNSSKNKAITEESTIHENTNVENFSMDSLIDEILSPIVSSSEFENEIIGDAQNEELDNNVDNLINNLISDIYTSTINVESQVNDNIITPEEVTDELFSPLEENTEDENNVVTGGTETTEDETASEASLIDTINTLNNTNESSKKSNELAVSTRSLSKFYLIKKKIKIAFCKFFRFMYKETNSTEL